MSEGGSPQFRIERNKTPTGADQKTIRQMHSALTPHTTVERVLAGAGRDESLDHLNDVDGVFEAKDAEGKTVGALTVTRGEDGWEIRHVQTDSHDMEMIAALIDNALAFAKDRGGTEISIAVSDRTDIRPILKKRDFEEIAGGNARTYRRYL